jgi:hypothetical protein
MPATRSTAKKRGRAATSAAAPQPKRARAAAKKPPAAKGSARSVKPEVKAEADVAVIESGQSRSETRSEA